MNGARKGARVGPPRFKSRKTKAAGIDPVLRKALSRLRNAALIVRWADLPLLALPPARTHLA
ncbi:hypothetical protein GCM10017600_87960 [Streptosporangium carneum]|uniref:Uncharacterized protein n=1 Tax=Streptosporangium carneum TaxID=47481 RepID=A0A9W6ICW3_9ACTN|nr:hypothetical protein GCM10017600_87960 [Streptosporangium carneum]